MNKVAGSKPDKISGGSRPDWADGLRRLYDSVVDEPIPDSFQDLLSELDKDRVGRPGGNS